MNVAKHKHPKHADAPDTDDAPDETDATNPAAIEGEAGAEPGPGAPPTPPVPAPAPVLPPTAPEKPAAGLIPPAKTAPAGPRSPMPQAAPPPAAPGTGAPATTEILPPGKSGAPLTVENPVAVKAAADAAGGPMRKARVSVPGTTIAAVDVEVPADAPNQVQAAIVAAMTKLGIWNFGTAPTVEWVE